jgi:hypothetical protein
MAVHWIGLGGLFAELLDATRPLLDRGGEARKQHDKAIKAAEGQVATAPHPGAPPLRVARAIPLAQILELEADPPLHWEGSGWRCAAPTRVVVRAADGREHGVALEAGAELPVRAGMLLMPPAPTAAS